MGNIHDDLKATDAADAETEPVFGFGPDDAGFGDANDPASGGVFASADEQQGAKEGE